jgi:putative tryptophan/tyrosine transport system substrate-binding protein
MRRREFITLVGGAAFTWPFAAYGQGPGRLRRIGALMPEPESYAESQARRSAFEQALAKFGWIVGKTLAIDYRWELSNLERARAAAAELLGLAPDVILTVATPPTVAAKSATSTIPVVFVAVAEPVSQGIVPSLAHPGGNLTGFSNMEPSFGGKWLEFLKEIAPSVTRVTTMFSPSSAAFAVAIAGSVEAAAQRFAVEAETALVHGPAEIEAAMTKLARAPVGGLILPPDPIAAGQRKLIVELAVRYRLPAIYGLKFFAAEDGLMFYGADILDQMRKAAGYVDRILRGENPAYLPVQQPTQFQLVINLRAAKAIGLDVPPTLLARADEVVE